MSGCYLWFIHGEKIGYELSQRERQPKMKEENTTRIKVTPDKFPKGKTNWEALDTMDDAEVVAAAVLDPDAQPTTEEELEKFQKAVDVKTIREKLSMTQEQFATTFHLPLSMLQDWEQAKSQPDQTARVLLKVIAHDPETVRSAIDKIRIT